MKNVVKAFSLIAILALGSCQPSKDSLKKDFIKGCVEAGDAKMDDAQMRQAFHEYCECAGEMIVQKMSVKEIVEMNNRRKEGHAEEVEAKFMPVIRPCLLDLEKKMSDLLGLNTIDSTGNQDTSTAPVPGPNK